jgi:hypothetical protein
MGQQRKEGTLRPGDKPPEKEDGVDFTRISSTHIARRTGLLRSRECLYRNLENIPIFGAILKPNKAGENKELTEIGIVSTDDPFQT